MKLKNKKTLLVGALSLLFGLTLSMRLGSLSNQSTIMAILMVIVFTVIIFGALSLLIRTKLFTDYLMLEKKTKRRWFLIALLVSALFLVVFPYQKPTIKTVHSLKVVNVENKYAPVEKPALITEIHQIKSGKLIDFSDLELDGWEITSEGLFSGSTGDTFTYSGEFSDGLLIITDPGTQYGMLEVTWDGKTTRYNLYEMDWGDPIFITLSKGSWGTPSALWLVMGVVTIIGDLSLVYVSFLVVLFGLMSIKQQRKTENKISAWMILAYAIPIILVWTLALFAFWPGLLPYDSLNQLSQAESGIIFDDHPAINSIYMRIMLSIWDNPVSPIIFRYILLAAAAGYTIYLLRRYGAPAWVAWVLCGIFAISPVTLTTSVNLWKDLPYAIIFLMMIVFILRLTTTKGAWFKKPVHWILFGVVAGLIAVVRHNGVLPVAAIYFLGLIIYRKDWLRWVGALAVTMVCYLLIIFPLYNAFNVQSGSAQMSIFSEWMGYGLGAYVYNEVDMPTDEMLYLDDVMSVTTGWNYDCYSFSKSYGTGDQVFPGGRAFLGTFFGRFLDDPTIYFKHWACNTEHLWRISQNDNPSASLWAAIVSDINQDTTDFFNLDIHSDSKLPQVKTLFVKYANWSLEDRNVNWFIWRPAFYFYIALGAFLINYFRTKNIGYLYLGAILITQVASLAIGIGSPWVRYSFPTMVVAMLVWPLLFWQPIEREAEDSSLPK
ncbi:MAG: hypothetical protein H0S79_22505 [Anaerolineaceae bacterium]|nr:hypothetical protein [Anaerolineaceae bacterium]